MDIELQRDSRTTFHGIPNVSGTCWGHIHRLVEARQVPSLGYCCLDHLLRRRVVSVAGLIVLHRAGADTAGHGEGGTHVGAHATAAEGHGITRGTASYRYRKARVVDGSRRSMDAHIDYLARRLRRGVVDNL